MNEAIEKAFPENINFRRYPSIENSYREEFIEKIRNLRLNTKWYIQEKIHGANFSVFCRDGKYVQFGRRSDFLRSDESFNFYQDITFELTEAILKLDSIIDTFFTFWGFLPNEEYSSRVIVVYGEFFGGGYDTLPKINKLKKIQTGVDYTDKHLFCAFDITVNGQYLDVPLTQAFLKEAGFFYSRFLAVYDTLDEALSHSDIFKSTIPALLDMPEHSGENVCEGIVIRPEQNIFLPTGSRLILKKKNDTFKEVSRQKKKKPDQNDYPDVDAFINENRYNAVRSKMLDDVTRDDLAKAFIADVIKDYSKEYPYHQLSDKEQKQIRRRMGRPVWEIIRRKY